ncbi:hypothetical protein GVY41_12885 [Frigidibacter albus]|uniref:Uncharacterized protein n=1 Tax=Frigidibacter albus TaxID=1465486 RepID=A0A6L8VK58_9RHOB|nr:hypothetical protein [Frigidibacter albus]MZQ89982.1 hypothetical protein [Frigidibacter albus]NBE31890.1 hypothetical protein [Frigidibacter albus]GGH57992.1 hypothetical protein GCM10011341_27950 [Frigidibacter albus]
MYFFSFVLQSTLLALEAQVVIEQRLTMMARGDAGAQDEVVRMVGEKMALAAHAWQHGAMSLATGTSPDDVMMATVTLYRDAVDENRRRLAA